MFEVSSPSESSSSIARNPATGLSFPPAFFQSFPYAFRELFELKFVWHMPQLCSRVASGYSPMKSLSHFDLAEAGGGPASIDKTAANSRNRDRRAMSGSP